MLLLSLAFYLAEHRAFCQPRFLFCPLLYQTGRSSRTLILLTSDWEFSMLTLRSNFVYFKFVFGFWLNLRGCKIVRTARRGMSARLPTGQNSTFSFSSSFSSAYNNVLAPTYWSAFHILVFAQFYLITLTAVNTFNVTVINKEEFFFSSACHAAWRLHIGKF